MLRMQGWQGRLAIISLMLSTPGGSAIAQNGDLGKAEYLSSCAACHGLDGKGDGPVASQLVKRPSDLTSLAKQNDGVFPAESLHDIIDGRTGVSGHGSQEMPIWGYRFVPPNFHDQKYEDDFILARPESPEAVVHARIQAVVDYLSRIQQH
jgi:mono/diheme cytochrome c family protein